MPVAAVVGGGTRYKSQVLVWEESGNQVENYQEGGSCL